MAYKTPRIKRGRRTDVEAEQTGRDGGERRRKRRRRSVREVARVLSYASDIMNWSSFVENVCKRDGNVPSLKP